MDTEYFAHSENEKNEKHLLSKHLHETARLAESFACLDEYKQALRLSGLLHDFGKYQPEFQNYLETGGRRGSVPHAKWGAGYARKNNLPEVSIAIDGHHKGLPDKVDWQGDTNEIFHNDEPGFAAVKDAFLKDTGFDEAALAVVPPKLSDSCQRELFMTKPGVLPTICWTS